MTRRMFIVEDHSGLLDLLGESSAGDGLPHAASEWKSVLAVDLDSLSPATASEVEQHERPFTYHGEWLLAQGLPTPEVNELARLRNENARLKAVNGGLTSLKMLAESVVNDTCIDRTEHIWVLTRGHEVHCARCQRCLGTSTMLRAYITLHGGQLGNG